MSESRPNVYTSLSIPWWALFWVVKLWGTALAGWSWWWMFCPVVPDVYLICQKVGLL